MRTVTRRLVVAAVLTIPLVAISMIPPLMFDGWQWVAFALATPVVFFSGAGFHRAALVNLRHGSATMDTLVSMGTLAAWTWSTVALFFLGAAEAPDDGMAGMAGMATSGTDAPHVYFETAGVIVTLILLGKWFEARAKRRSGDAHPQAGRARRPHRSARRRHRDRPRGPRGRRCASWSVPARRSPPTAWSSTATRPSTWLMVTGEPVPVEVGPGDDVIGATVNTNGHLVVEATRVGADTALAQIVRLVEEAQGSQAPIQRLADRVRGRVRARGARHRPAHARRLAASPATRSTTPSPPPSPC